MSVLLKNLNPKIPKNWKMVFVCPGQGGHFIGMGKEFNHGEEYYEEASEVLKFDIK